MGLLSSLYPWDYATYGNGVKTLRVLVECEKGSVHKYEYDDTNSAMVIVRDLDKRFPYKYNYGSIPQTLADDGDSLDAIVVSDEPIRSGTVVNCYPLAIIRMTDNGSIDDKVLCVPFYITDGNININKILNYLKNYKYPKQKGTNLRGIDGVESAVAEIEEAHKRFMENNK